MNRYLSWIISCLFLFTSITNLSFAQQSSTHTLPTHKKTSFSSECDRLKQNLAALQKEQNSIRVDGKTMPELRTQMNKAVAKLAIYEGIQKKIDLYIQQRDDLIKQFAPKQLTQAEELLDKALKVNEAYQDLRFLYAYFSGQLNDQKKMKEDAVIPSAKELRDNLHTYLTGTGPGQCGISYFSSWENPYEPYGLRKRMEWDNLMSSNSENGNQELNHEEDNQELNGVNNQTTIQGLSKAQKKKCIEIAGLATNLRVLVESENDQPDADELIKNVQAKLKQVVNSSNIEKVAINEMIQKIPDQLSKPRNNLKKCYQALNLDQYKNRSNSSVSKCLTQKKALEAAAKRLKTAFQQTLNNTINDTRDKKIKAVREKVEKSLYAEAKRLLKNQKKLKNDSDQIRAGNAADKQSKIDSFYDSNVSVINELCDLPNLSEQATSQQLQDCVENLATDMQFKNKLSAVKDEVKAIQDQMIKIRNHGTYYNIEAAKKYILIDQKDYCFKTLFEADNKNCSGINAKLGQLENFLNIGQEIALTVSDLNQVRKGVYMPDSELANVCQASATVKKNATFICDRAIKKMKRKQNDEKLRSRQHVFYDKKKKKYRYEKRDTATTMAVSAFANNLMPALNGYLYADGLSQQNNYLYQQAVMQKNMNYLNNQQFDWYMKNYSLYGTDPYALNAGYDPYYAGTFQFGNPNFVAYNGYYSY